MHNRSKGLSKLLTIFFLLIAFLLVAILISVLSEGNTAIREDFILLKGIEYPTEISDLKANDILSLNCSNTYHKQSDNNYSSTTDDQGIFLSDPTVTSFLKSYNSSNTKDISEIIKCSYSDEKVLLLYSVVSETDNTWYVGVLNKDNSAGRHIAISNNKTPNFLCRWPIAITKDQHFFVECGGGTGQDIEATIYMVDLKDGNLIEIT